MFETEKTKHDDFILSQTQTEKDGKFKETRRTVKDGQDFEVHEYVNPEGKAGYQIFMFAEKDGKEYFKSVGYGVEAKSRTWDWKIYNDNTRV